MIRILDLVALEKALEAAEVAFKNLNDDVDEWSAFESMDKQGKRSLNVSALHYERRDAALAGITAAEQQLLATKQLFFAGVVDHAAN